MLKVRRCVCSYDSTFDNAVEGAALIKYMETEIAETRRSAYEATGIQATTGISAAC